MPQKTICQNDCERCKRTWYSDSENKTSKVIVRMVDPTGGKVIDCSYDVLCEGCTQTVKNLLSALARDMKKLGSSKPRAKKEGASAPSEPEGSTAVPGSVPEQTPAVVPPPSRPYVPSKRP